jgi:hypothetical protein
LLAALYLQTATSAYQGTTKPKRKASSMQLNSNSRRKSQARNLSKSKSLAKRRRFVEDPEAYKTYIAAQNAVYTGRVHRRAPITSIVDPTEIDRTFDFSREWERSRDSTADIKRRGGDYDAIRALSGRFTIVLAKEDQFIIEVPDKHGIRQIYIHKEYLSPSKWPELQQLVRKAGKL